MENLRLEVVFYRSQAGEDLKVLLHGFVKKTQKIPKKELDVSRRRLKQIKEER